MSITFTAAPHGPELNLANGNAARVLELLGYNPEESCGQAPAEDFLGRTLIAQALLDVATDDEHGRPPVTDGRHTWCGTRPGYLAERLAELQALATWAHHHHSPIIWG